MFINHLCKIHNFDFGFDDDNNNDNEKITYPRAIDLCVLCASVVNL